MNDGNLFRKIYDILDRRYGPQHWWPAESAFEVMVGAVLVQNTSWSNASRAITRLRENDMLSVSAIRHADDELLARTIVSCGYFNIKAKRLKALCQWLHARGGIEAAGRQGLQELRQDLLQVHGIGPETADDILLYAFGLPVFVIDAYTRRLFGRIGLTARDAAYEDLRQIFESRLGEDTALYNQYHALIVHHAKHVCRKTPECSACCLHGLCNHG